MASKSLNLFSWDGEISRFGYWTVGIIGFAIKYNLDRFIAATWFQRSWSVFSYLVPDATRSSNLDELPADDIALFSAFLLAAIPFIIVGVGLTIRRLRAVRLPTWLVVLFFVPFINLLFFIMLGLIPSKAPPAEGEALPAKAVGGPVEGRERTILDRIIPESAVGAAGLAVVFTGLVSVLLTVTSVNGLGQYGLALFVGIPFSAGLVSSLIYGYHKPRSLLSCLGVGVLSALFLGLCLLAVAIEGVFCIAMAAPIGGGLAAFGAGVGWVIQLGVDTRAETKAALGVLLIGLPVLMGAEGWESREAPLIRVSTEIEVDAPPATVWRHVVTFSELPPPEDKLFQLTGIAYPLRATIEGSGVGAVRRCEFTTGPFVEPITVWDEPKLLRFTVTSQPRSMEESSPWGQIDAPHIDDYLVSQGGQFELSELPGSRTRLVGTTWYRHKIWPATYWRVWSDGIIHAIHMRVLRHVRQLSEQDLKK